jgi:hypothetical protein
LADRYSDRVDGEELWLPRQQGIHAKHSDVANITNIILLNDPKRSNPVAEV